jgi:hypothetical protein
MLVGLLSWAILFLGGLSDRVLSVLACNLFLLLALGIICPNDGVLLNPGRLRLRYGDKAIVLARSIEEATGSVQIEYSSDEPEPSEICVATDLLDQCHGQGMLSWSASHPHPAPFRFLLSPLCCNFKVM